MMLSQAGAKTPVSFFTITLTAMLLVVAAAVRFPSLLPRLGADLSIAQLAALPLVLLLMLRWNIAGCRVPRLLLLAGCFAALCAVSVSLSGPRRKSLVVARLQNDNFENDTYIFKEKIRNELAAGRSSKVRAVQQRASFQSSAEAERFLRENPAALALVWGGKNWLNVSFSPDDAVFFPEEALGDWLGITGLKLVKSVPSIGFSFNPEDDSVRFLAELFAALPVSGFHGVLSDSARFAVIEQGLRKAGSMRAPWSLFAHRAYPYWVLGNLYLARALQNGRYERAELNCALAAYERARDFLRPADNLDLLAAAINNRAVVMYVMSWMEADPRLRQAAMRQFWKAGHLAKTRKGSFLSAALGTARANFAALNARQNNAAIKSGGKKKQAGMKRKPKKGAKR